MSDQPSTFAVTGIDTEPVGEGTVAVTFGLLNPGEPVWLHESWLPHDEFHSERIDHDPPLRWDGTLALRHEVAWNGGEVPNAFLILRLESRRVFIRLRPGPAGIVVEKITEQS